MGKKGKKSVLMQSLCTLAAISKLQTPMPLRLLPLETKKKSNAMLCYGVRRLSIITVSQDSACTATIL